MANQSLEERLAAMDAQPKAKQKPRIGVPAAGAVIVAALSVGAYFVAVKLQENPDARLRTSDAQEFQQGGGTGGRLAFDAPAADQQVEDALIKISDQLQAPPTPPVATAPNDALAKELAELRRALAESSLNRDKAIASAVGELRGAFDDQVQALKDQALKAENELKGLKSLGDTRVMSLEALLDAEKSRVAALEASLASREDADLEVKMAEQAERDALELLTAQVKSPALIFANSQSAASGGTGTGGNVVSNDGRALSSDEAFLKDAPALVIQEGQQMENPDRTLAQGSVIQAALQVAINSDLPGNVVAVVSEPVPAYSGDSILVPRGSRLFGSYSAGIDAGQKRILIVWSRILTPDGVSMNISAVGGDNLGRSGLTGFVDTKFGARFGGAALISMIGAAPSVASAQVNDEIASDTLANIGSNLQDATSTVIADQLALKPTIYVDQGANVTVLVDRDIVVY